MWKLFFALSVCVSVAACDTANFRTSRFDFGDAKFMSATGNLRFVTERQRPEDRLSGYRTICTEPSPDYAAAANQSFSAKVSGLESGASTAAGGEVGAQLNEVIQLGQGRTAGVLALRDGLYSACQAYANGIIGKDAFSIIISQYGLLVATVARSSATGTPDTHAVPASSARAAMLVACISAHDRTRPDGAGSLINPLLDLRTCRQIMRLAGQKT